jgi:Endosomal/lysosomal potassium channel TMEM175
MASTRYQRPSERDDFGRVMSFTDAVFAIAMTLLVVEVGVPETIGGAPDDPGALLDAFADKGPLIFAFFLGCYIIGFYRAAHHRFMSWPGAGACSGRSCPRTSTGGRWGRRCCRWWRSRCRSRSPSPCPGWPSPCGCWRSRSSWSGPATGRRPPATTSAEA